MIDVQSNDMPSTINKNLFTMFDDSKILEQEELCYELANQYSATLTSLDQESLDQTLLNSLFNSTNPQPLVLYIHNDQSIATQIFNETVLWSESVGTYLTAQFVLWSWNLTKENYHELLTTVVTHVGEEVGAVIDSSLIEIYPLLICLIFDRGVIKVESIIQGTMSESEAFSLLIQTRDAFDSRFDLPDTTGLSLTTISTENWSVPASILTKVNKESGEFRRVADDFDNGASSIVEIHRIDNIVWLMQYLNQKKMIDSRIEDNATEKFLFHGCPYASAEQILNNGFDHFRIGKNGTVYGRGFYFSASRMVSDRYAIPDPLTNEKRILMCRVLIGRSCQGNPTMRTCPSNYDSTTGESNIHVVYSNRHVLPEYLITYK
ncbi:unnamed protein product [Adineta steineri]|uniref:Poly [ADP-ribose] polymerase n=1 Tax=Adineta steineri TaxID=433720 RepID=A0A815AXB1_9BILA|nr:unnamed protein product [Adineta steineri]